MEEHFKNKLNNHKVDWDKEELLGNIQQELTSNDNSSNWKWLLLLPILLLSTCYGWNYLQQPTSDSSLGQADSKPVTNEVRGTVNENSIIQKDIQGEIKTKDNSNSTVENTTKQVDKIIAKSKPSDLGINKEVNTNASSNSYTQNAKPSPSHINSSSQNRTGTLGEQTSTLPPVNENTTDKPKSSLSDVVADDVASIVSNTNIRNAESISKNVAKRNDEITSTIAPLEPLGLTFIELNPKEGSRHSTLVPMMDDYSLEDNLDKEIDELLKSNFYFSASADIGLVYRNRKFSVQGEELLRKLEANEETEKSLYIFSNNIFFGYQHDTSWSLQVGLEYNHVKEVFDFYEISVDTLLRDDLKVFRTEERTIKHYNDYKFYTLPFQLGYQFDLKKAKLTTRLGASYTFAHNFQGRRNQIDLIGSGEIDIVDIHEGGYYNFNLIDRIGIQAGLTLEYPFMDKHQFFTSATYRRSPTLGMRNFEELRPLIEQNFHSISIGAGFKFAIGGKD